MRNRPQIESLEARQMLAADFTLVAVSDTQYAVESFPEAFQEQTVWAAGAAATQNIKFFAVQGDMLRRGYSNAQATVAKDALDTLNGVVSYTTSIGNHDYDNQFDDLDNHVSSANWTSYFGDAMFTRQGAGSGFAGSSLDQRNRFQIIQPEAGGQRYMVMSLEWAAPDPAIAWAQSVISAYPNIPVILSTHEYLNNSSGRTQSTLDPIGNSGEAIWTKLVDVNPQIFLVLSGHTGAVGHRTELNDAGLPVFETCSDFEGRSGNEDGWMQLFKFSPATNKITVSTYSAVLSQYDTSSSAYAYELPLDFATRFAFSGTPVPIDTNTTAPVAGADTVATEEGETVTFNPVTNDTDADGDAVKAILSSLPANGAVYVNANGTFSYTPDPKFTGVDTFTYYPVDSKVRGAEVTVTVNVADTAVAYNYPTVNGTNLDASDGVAQRYTSTPPTWQFNVTGGTEVTFAVNAKRDWNSYEYRFQYSTNNSTWLELTQIVTDSSRYVTRTAYSPDEPYQMWRLPPTTRGALYVRVYNPNSGTAWATDLDEMFVMNTGPAPVLTPAAPTLLTGSYSKRAQTASLRWVDNATNETGYKVWYSSDGATWNYWTVNKANSTKYTTPKLTRGLTYQFKVSAYNAYGESGFSNTITIVAT